MIDNMTTEALSVEQVSCSKTRKYCLYAHKDFVVKLWNTWSYIVVEVLLVIVSWAKSNFQAF